jgi:hypothetical protein
MSRPDIFLSVLCSDTPISFSFVGVEDQVSRVCGIIGKIIGEYILTCMFLNRRQETLKESLY